MMGLSGIFGSVMTMPLELAATARSSRRRISSEAGRSGSPPRRVREEEVSNPRILQPSATPHPACEDDQGISSRRQEPANSGYNTVGKGKPDHERRNDSGIRATTVALRLRCLGAHYRRTDNAPPPRKTPQYLCDQSRWRSGEASRGRPGFPRGASRQPGSGPRRYKNGGEKQRRRPLKPLHVLADHGPERSRRRRAFRGSSLSYRLLIRIV